MMSVRSDIEFCRLICLFFVFLLLGGHRDCQVKLFSRKTITDKVLEALTSPDVLNKIIPILSEKICETIEAAITDIVDDKIKTHVDAHVNALIETVNKQQKTITEHKHFQSKQLLLILSKQQLKCLTFPLSSTGTLMLWKRRLVRLEYCS
jgi:hypothetical protein